MAGEMGDRRAVDRPQDRGDVRRPALQRDRARIQLARRALSSARAWRRCGPAASTTRPAPARRRTGASARSRPTARSSAVRPRSDGSSAQGSACSAPVGASTSSRSPSPRRQRSDQQLVERLRGSARPLPQRAVCGAPRRKTADAGRARTAATPARSAICAAAPERMPGQPSAGEHQRGQLAVELDQLNQRTVRERVRERVPGRALGSCRPAGLRGAWRRRSRIGALRAGLARDQRVRRAAAALGACRLGADLPQFGGRRAAPVNAAGSRDRAGVRWPAAARLQTSTRVWPAGIRQRGPQPDPGELDAERGGGHAQLRGAQRRAVLIEQSQARACRALRRGIVAGRSRDQRFDVPLLDPVGDRRRRGAAPRTGVSSLAATACRSRAATDARATLSRIRRASSRQPAAASVAAACRPESIAVRADSAGRDAAATEARSRGRDATRRPVRRNRAAWRRARTSAAPDRPRAA